MRKAITQKKSAYRALIHIARYLILTAILSFIGWLYETLLVRVRNGYWTDRGFLFLPFCPIYGVTLIFVYFFIGTPKEKRGVLKNIQNPFAHTTLYLFFAFLIPTTAELLVGLFFDKTFHLSLWSYAALPINFKGYISLPVSLAWSGLIYIFMRFFFTPLQKITRKIPENIAICIAACLIVSVAVDAVIQFTKI